ncbi:MAG: serine/threonine protein kinase [Rhodocyclaceae bacterium]|nr:serine/threonine protein kinase [Rhodocyclaceae bacterium]
MNTASSASSLGGFSIVYLAFDQEDTPVAIKEYLPNSLALRSEGDALPSIAEENVATFRYGMKCFFRGRPRPGQDFPPQRGQGAELLPRQRNGLMVMHYERGRTLQEHIQKHKGEIRESFIRAIFRAPAQRPARGDTHKLLHLDIKPSNIYLRNDGTPVLIDFGAARQTLSLDTPLLKPMYTPGFAAPEQYNNTRRELLGPWTDIYSVGASMYACMAAAAPQAADQRLERDQLATAAKRWPDKYSKQLLNTVDWCMRLNYLERPQSVFALQKALADKERSVPRPTFLGGLRKRVRDLIK